VIIHTFISIDVWLNENMQIQVIANFVMFSVITLLRDGHMLHQVKLQIEYGLMTG
jgi:hypothetical protein